MSSVVDREPRSVHELFEQQARRTPRALALIDGDRRLSFGELERRANRLARHLRECGVAREALIGLCLPRSATLVEAILATLKAGAAYVPLDPEQPARAAAVLADARPPVVLTDADHVGLLPSSEAMVLCLDDRRQVEAIGRRGAEALELHDPDALAHVLYTSGSTGRPKGVLGTHRNELNRLAWMHASYPWVADEVGCLKTALSFIDCFSEIFWPLPQGAPLCCAPSSAARDPRQLVALLATHGVTRLCAVPSLLATLCEGYPDLAERLPRLRMVFSCGEPLSTALARELLARLPGCRLFNLYGSTELTADVTCCEVDAALLARCGPIVPIGQAIANMELLVVDEAGQPQPAGVVGELWGRGPGVARGYLRRPSAGRAAGPDTFIADDPPTYRTGDRGRLREDGLLEVLGRVDQQLKIRGHRVELGEIEAALLARADVREAVVVLRRDPPAPEQLHAYLVAAPGQALASEQTLAAELGERLPTYMVPSRYVALERLPRGPSGKVDRSALPEPPRQQALVVVAPEGERQATIVEIWRRALARDDIGLTQSFFALGGDSLSALKMLLEVEARLGGRVSESFFEQPTVAHLAASLAGAERAAVPTEGRGGRQAILPTRSLRERFVHFVQQLPERLALTQPFERGLAVLRWLCGHPARVERLYGEQLALARRFCDDAGVADPKDERARHALLCEMLRRQFEKATDRATGRDEIAAALRRQGAPFWRPFTELASGSARADEQLAARYALEGVERLQRVAAKGRGVIVLSYHTPLLRLALPALYQLGLGEVRFAALSKRLTVARWRGEPAPVIAERFAAATAAFTHELYRTLSGGGALLMAGEGKRGRARCELSIAGRRYRLRAGFAELALRSGAIVVPLTMALRDDGRIALRFEQPLSRGPRGVRRAERAVAMTRRYGAFVDRALRRAPESLALRRMAYHLSLPPAEV